MIVESILILAALLAMVLSLPLIVIPAVPVTVLEWAITMIFVVLSTVLTGTSRVTLPAGLLMTAFMLLGATSQFWMPFFGLRGGDLSCTGLLAFFVGMIAGTILIPVPFLGTIIGGVVAVFIVEFARIKETRQAMKSSGTALRVMVYGMIAEFVFAVSIVAVFIITIITTHPG